ncbi:hypothetical protein KSP40_PGU000559 [Platanthera guangdongensis]|uniref:Uncharacterized protein n=1 Tax=Platanthera guangdongensis TaxID=2320717 RepID=A0ABR2LZ54_9ASPA
MHWCAICQEYRDMKGRLSFNVELLTMIKPPIMKEMSANKSPEATDSGSSNTDFFSFSIVTTSTLPICLIYGLTSFQCELYAIFYVIYEN